MNPQRILRQAYLALVSIPTGATDYLCPRAMMPLEPGPSASFNCANTYLTASNVVMFTTIAVHSSTAASVAKPPARY